MKYDYRLSISYFGKLLVSVDTRLSQRKVQQNIVTIQYAICSHDLYRSFNTETKTSTVIRSKNIERTYFQLFTSHLRQRACKRPSTCKLHLRPYSCYNSFVSPSTLNTSVVNQSPHRKRVIMPPAYTPKQRQQIQQFSNFTEAKDSVAAKVSDVITLCPHTLSAAVFSSPSTCSTL